MFPDSWLSSWCLMCGGKAPWDNKGAGCSSEVETVVECTLPWASGPSAPQQPDCPESHHYLASLTAQLRPICSPGFSCAHTFLITTNISTLRLGFIVVSIVKGFFFFLSLNNIYSFSAFIIAQNSLFFLTREHFLACLLEKTGRNVYASHRPCKPYLVKGNLKTNQPSL